MRAPHGQRLPVPHGFEVGAGDGHHHVPQRLEPQTHDGGFQRGRIFGVPCEQVGDPQGEAVQRPARRNTVARKAGAAQVLNRGQNAGMQHLEGVYGRHVSTSSGRMASNFTVSPMSRSEGGCRCGSNSSIGVQPMICQPPGLSTG